MITIALVGGAGPKREGRHQGKSLYSSTLFSYSRQYAEANSDRWFILSAKYGLLDPDEVVDSYPLTLRNAPLPFKERWAHKVYDQIMALKLDEREVRILWLADNNYKSALSPMLTRFKQDDPVRGMKLGPRMAWLKGQIER